MKAKNQHIILAALVTSLIACMVTGCSDSDSLSTSKFQTCIEPENPYDEGSGHYAGYQWAIENNAGCDGDSDSDSFNEGCEDYYNQLDDYESCLSSKQ